MLFDKDGSGHIDREELKDALRALGFQKDAQDPNKIQALMDQADKDGSGSIDKEEFRILMARFISKGNKRNMRELL